MSAPDLWGIDPDELFRWTPNEGRVVIDEGDYDAEKKEWKRLPKYGEALPGAPVILVSAPSEALAIKIDHARQSYRLMMARTADANRSMDFSEITEKILDKGESIYTPALVSEVLAACIEGWENVKARGGKKEIAFKPGDWKRNSRALPGSWQASLFNAIVSETLFDPIPSGSEEEPAPDPFSSTPG